MDMLALSINSMLGEALANLVDNGIKFTPPGGSVEIARAVEGDGAVLRVSDTGAGLRPGAGVRQRAGHRLRCRAADARRRHAGTVGSARPSAADLRGPARLPAVPHAGRKSGTER